MTPRNRPRHLSLITDEHMRAAEIIRDLIEAASRNEPEDAEDGAD